MQNVSPFLARHVQSHSEPFRTSSNLGGVRLLSRSHFLLSAAYSEVVKDAHDHRRRSGLHYRASEPAAASVAQSVRRAQDQHDHQLGKR